KEKYTRGFEELTSELLKIKKVSKNQLCPCGSGKKYKDCCEKKELKWVYQNKKITKILPMNNEVSKSIKKLSKDFTKTLGRKPYGYENLFNMLGRIDSSFENIFSKMTDLNLPLAQQYATIKTGMFLSEFNYDQFSDLDLDEWNEAIEEFEIKNAEKKYKGKSIFEVTKEANLKLKTLNRKISDVEMMMNIYLNTFAENYKNLNITIENQKDFSMVCARKIIIDANILLSAFDHKSIEEVTNITRIIFEDLIQTAVLLKEKKLFEEKIIPLTLFEKGILEHKKNTEGKLSKNILIDPKNAKEYNIKINIKDLSLKNQNYQNFYDNIFDGMSSFIHLNINKIPKYFNIPNPLTEVQEYKTTGLLGLFFLNQCIYEIKSNIKLDHLLLRDMEYIYSKNVTYINACLKILLTLEPDNEIYNDMLKIQIKCAKTINPNNKIKLYSKV
ncbi:MAG: SEC-C domain-containing protein, partial [Bacilli bacterium]|nr:SEC-C domain-containing protein [Bacilli bacterium]